MTCQLRVSTQQQEAQGQPISASQWSNRPLSQMPGPRLAVFCHCDLGRYKAVCATDCLIESCARLRMVLLWMRTPSSPTCTSSLLCHVAWEALCMPVPGLGPAFGHAYVLVPTGTQGWPWGSTSTTKIRSSAHSYISLETCPEAYGLGLPPRPPWSQLVPASPHHSSCTHLPPPPAQPEGKEREKGTPASDQRPDPLPTHPCHHPPPTAAA